MKVVPATVGPVRVSGVPSLDSCASTISTERSESTTDGLNSTVQVRVTVDPVLTELVWSLVIITEAGVGTEGRDTTRTYHAGLLHNGCLSFLLLFPLLFVRWAINLNC